MSLNMKKRTVRIIGVALAGRGGSPVVVLDDPINGDFLPVSADPFDAEILIRDYIGEGDRTAAAWLGDLLKRSPPRRAVLEIDDDGRPHIQFRKNQYLPLGEGLALVRRLSIPLFADERMFDNSADELSFLTETRAFSGDFLYLTPPQYAPNIPMV
jgi:hypothetical protein